MNRGDVIRKLRQAARAKGLNFQEIELTRHTAIVIGSTSRTLGRYDPIDDVTAHKFWDQYAEVFGGKGWWR
ncbi:MAG: ribonuclease PH [Propionibacteriaceae bacterium]|nr:ribonuclease PH [Propionibacteriaceae bacterium]